jgi:iron complex outermembrane receptor protein
MKTDGENNHSVPLFNENNVNNFQKITKELTYIHMFRLVRFTSSFMKILSVRTAALPALLFPLIAVAQPAAMNKPWL